MKCLHAVIDYQLGSSRGQPRGPNFFIRWFAIYENGKDSEKYARIYYNNSAEKNGAFAQKMCTNGQNKTLFLLAELWFSMKAGFLKFFSFIPRFNLLCRTGHQLSPFISTQRKRQNYEMKIRRKLFFFRFERGTLEVYVCEDQWKIVCNLIYNSRGWRGQHFCYYIHCWSD